MWLKRWYTVHVFFLYKETKENERPEQASVQHQFGHCCPGKSQKADALDMDTENISLFLEQLFPKDLSGLPTHYEYGGCVPTLSKETKNDRPNMKH